MSAYRFAFAGLLLSAAAALGSAADAPDPRFPPDAAVPAPMPPAPQPLPAPDAPVKLGKGMYYVVRSATPLVVVQTAGTGAVSVSERDGSKRPLTIPAEWALGWPADPADPEFVMFADKCLYVVKAKKSGPVTLLVVPAMKQDKDGKAVALDKADLVFRTFDVDDGTTPPVPPPAPKPDPKVDPEPGDAPIPGAGLRVLVVYESGDLPKLPAAQLDVLYAAKVREYLNATCPAGPDGKTREWRMWDQDVDASGDAKAWQEAMKRPRKSVPWVIVSNGKTGFEGPLPASVDEFLTLVKKYGG